MSKPIRCQDAPGSGESHNKGVAIIGMSCLLPGASDLRTFWDNVLQKKPSITIIPHDRWDWRLFYNPDAKVPDKIVSKWGGFIDPIYFDPLEFGMPPDSLYSIEPVQLMTLHAVRAALEDAGFPKKEFNKETCGVILGAGNTTPDLAQRYAAKIFLQQNVTGSPKELLERLPSWTEDSFAGTLINVLAGRIANRFDLGGMNFTIDAACASSLAAIGQAVNELETGGCDMVVAGGVDGTQSPLSYMNFSKSGALSPTGTCVPFDQAGNGTVISEGIAILVLKRLADAKRDGDRVYAAIKGVGGASDGKAKSITSPNPAGQGRALRQAYRRAGISPSTIELVEAHGTGTAAGDSAELASLTEVFQEAGSPRGGCALGSAKSVIGHTKAAAGAVGMIKCALALYHKVLPPTLGINNPLVALHTSPFFPNTHTRPWIHADSVSPRRAGVTGIGFGGINFHAVLEEHLSGEPSANRAPVQNWEAELILVPGESVDAIGKNLVAIANAAGSLRDLSWTLWMKIKSGETPGAAIVAANREDLRKKIKLLSDFLEKDNGRTGMEDASGVYYQPPVSDKGKIAFVFPGQGSQYPGMMQDLTALFQGLRTQVECADRLFANAYAEKFSAVLYPAPAFTPEQEKEAQKKLMRTHYAQPALGLCSLNLFKILKTCKVPAHMMAGHSYGEYAALCAAGAFSLESLLKLSETRGRLMTEMTAGKDMGTMAAVAAVSAELAPHLAGISEVWITNLNSPRQTMLSGSQKGIAQALTALKAAGIEGKTIPVSGAFHSPLFSDVGRAFAEFLETIDFSGVRTPVYANRTGGLYGKEPNDIPALLKDHMVCPVQFIKQVETMYQDGARVFVEIGPKSVLCGLIGQILSGKPHAVVPMDNPKEPGVAALLKGLARISSRGFAVDLDFLFEGRTPMALDLSQSAPSAPALSKTAWEVTSAMALPVSMVEKKKDTSPVVLTSSGAYESTPPIGDWSHMDLNESFPATGSNFDEVMHRHQQLMKRFLDMQERVMTSYLTGQPVRPSAPAESAASKEGADPVVSNPPKPSGQASGAPVERTTPSSSVAAQIIEIVSQRTGYPNDMLDVNADMEADLSIDSIKKVEILGAIQDKVFSGGTVPYGVNPQGAARLKTLAEIIQWVQSAMGTNAPAAAASKEKDRSEISGIVLAIVSQRTGYPTDMLNPKANMEGDLGIDSIKRVEILGAIQDELFPGGLPEGVNLEGVNRLHTLDAITDWLEKALEKSGPSQATVSAKEPAKQILQEPKKELPRFVLRAVPLEPSDSAPPQFGPSSLFLITDDENGNAEILKRKLAALGAKAVLVRHGKNTTGPDKELYQTDLTHPESVFNIAEQIRQQHGPISGIIHLVGLRKKKSFEQIVFDEWNDRLALDIKSLFCLAKAFQKDLQIASEGKSAWLLAGVQFDGTFLAQSSAKSEFDPGQMGISGVVKTLGLEWPQVHCRIIDFEPSESLDARADQIIREMSMPGFEPEVGYQGGRRFVLRVEKEALDPQTIRGPIIESDWIVLITGGARGITAEVAKEIAAKFRPTIILVGRSPLPDPEGADTAYLKTENELKSALIRTWKQSGEKLLPKQVQQRVTHLLRNREILGNIEHMKAAGAKVTYFSADVCDGEEFGRLIKGAYEKHGRLDLVIHGAGIIEDNLIENKSFESFCRVFDTKAQSVFWLARHLRFESLKGLVLFSSVVGRFGNRGQTDYSATNEVVNKVARYLNPRYPGRTVAINFGPWASSGMVSAGVEMQLKERDVQLVPADLGRKAVDSELTFGRKDDVEVVVGDGLWRNLNDTQAALDTYHGAEHNREDDSDLPAVAQKLGLPYLYAARWKSRGVEKSEIEVQLRIMEHPYLLDHRMDRKVVIPFAVAMEIASQAAKAVTHGSEVVRVQEFRAIKGIIFEGAERNLLVTLIPGTKDLLEIRIALADKAKYFTHKGIFQMGRAKIEAPAESSRFTSEKLEAFPYTVQSAYAKLLFHGPSLQTIQRFEGISANRIQAEFKPSQPVKMVKAARNDAWIFDPVMLDGVSQLAGLWLTVRYDMTCFPAAFGTLTAYNAFSEEPVLCELEIKNYSGGSAMHVDVTFRGKQGFLLAQVRDFEFSCSKSFNRFRGTYEPAEMPA